MIESPPMELILAMDTSGDVCSVATLRKGSLVSEHTFRHGMHLSERLLDHVHEVLRDAEGTPEDVTAFAVGLGPGSFTGTRIGVMTMKTFSSVLKKPLYGIESLEAIARSYAGIRNTLVIPMHPCRTGIVYTAAYTMDTGEPVGVISPTSLPVSDLVNCASQLPSTTLLFCGSASIRYRDELISLLGENAIRAVFGEAMVPRAFDIGKLALARCQAGIPPEDPIELVPHYISPPPITMPKVKPVMNSINLAEVNSHC